MFGLAEGERLDVRGRPDVFSGPTDFVYVPRDSSVVVTATVGGRFGALVCSVYGAQAVLHQPADAVPVELRAARDARAARSTTSAPSRRSMQTSSSRARW